MRVYLAAPIFSQQERRWNREIATAIETGLPRATVTLPQDFRTGGALNDESQYGALFRRCAHEVSQADVVVAILDGPDVDSGTAFEMGLAYGRGIPVIGLRTDYRPGADRGVNLMCAQSCSYLAREFSFQEDPGVAAAAVVRRLLKLGT